MKSKTSITGILTIGIAAAALITADATPSFARGPEFMNSYGYQRALWESRRARAQQDLRGTPRRYAARPHRYRDRF